MQYCRLWYSKLNENVLQQRAFDRKLQENIFPEVNFLKLLKKELPHLHLS